MKTNIIQTIRLQSHKQEGAPVRRDLFPVLTAVAAIILLAFASVSSAEECFNASKRLTDDAQAIRLKAMDMGWQVGKTVSLTVGSVVKSKAEIYPKDDVEICLRVENGELQIRVQSQSKDAEKAKWREIYAKRIDDQTKK